MNITNTQLLRGCILSSIAHAIMTNYYPDLSYEQSWDGYNYSIQDGRGRRGTITFLDDCCIGAVRNEKGNAIQGFDAIGKCMVDFPEKLRLTAEAEVLQYLLVNHNGEAIPSVTSLFWCNQNGLYAGQACDRSFQNDFSLFEVCCLPLKLAVEALVDYYDMGTTAVQLFLALVEQKGDCLSKKIFLTEDQKRMLPGETIHSACVESLSELNIFL